MRPHLVLAFGPALLLSIGPARSLGPPRRRPLVLRRASPERPRGSSGSSRRPAARRGFLRLAVRARGFPRTRSRRGHSVVHRLFLVRDFLLAAALRRPPRRRDRTRAPPRCSAAGAPWTPPLILVPAFLSSVPAQPRHVAHSVPFVLVLALAVGAGLEAVLPGPIALLAALLAAGLFFAREAWPDVRASAARRRPRSRRSGPLRALGFTRGGNDRRGRRLPPS